MTAFASPFQGTSTDELTHLIEQYPWFAAARVELCRRAKGEGRSLYAQTAAWAGSLRMLYDIAHDLEQAPAAQEESIPSPEEIIETPAKKVRVAGGDFFSQDDYDDVRTDADELISDIGSAVAGERVPEEESGAPVPFCTEPLAQIYAEQGYTAQARYIYSQLSLRYPEKSAYFAALIQKLDE